MMMEDHLSLKDLEKNNIYFETNFHSDTEHVAKPFSVSNSELRKVNTWLFKKNSYICSQPHVSYE